MKVLVCGGAKTKNIVVGLEKKFGHIGIEFLVVNDIDSVEEIYGKGEYFDRALICEQGVTKDGLYRNEEEKVRGSICNFAVSASMHNMAGANYVFLTADMEMAEIMHEELLPLRNDSVVVVKASPYSIGFFSSLIATDLDKLDRNIVFKPVTEEDVDSLDVFDNNVKEAKEKQAEKDEYTFANDNESLEDFALSNIEDNESDGMMLDGDEYRDIQSEKKNSNEVEEAETEELEVDAVEDDEPEEELEVEVEEEKEHEQVGEVPSYKEFKVPVKFDEAGLNEENTEEPELELEVEDDDTSDEDEELEVELDEEDDELEVEDENNETGELTDYSEKEPVEDDEELEVDEDEPLDEEEPVDEEEELEVDTPSDEEELEVEEDETPDDELAGEVPDNHVEKFIENDFEALDLEDENGLFEDEPVEKSENNSEESSEELEIDEEDTSENDEELEVEEDELEVEDEASDDEESDKEVSDDEEVEELEEVEEIEEVEDETDEDEDEPSEEEENFVNKEKGHRNMKKEDESFNNYSNDEAAHREGKGFAEVDKANFKKTLDLFANRGTMFLVTGTHGSGATTVGFNLANTLSRLGYKTLVIDCDSEIKSMSFASKEIYESMEPSASCLREAINGNNISDFVTIVRPNFHVLCDGIASDTYQFDREIHKDRFTNFAIKLKQTYQFVVFAMSSKLAVDYCEDITYMCDDIIYTIQANKYGITKALLDLCNIDSDAMQRQMFQKSSILYNQMDRLNDLYGYKVKNPKDIATCMDKYLYDLVGDAADDLKFSKMKLLGYIPDIDNYMSQGLFNGKCWSDTEAGRNTYIGVLKSILFKK